MAIKLLVNPFEAPTTVAKHELGIIVSDPRGHSGNKSYQEVLPQSGTGTTGAPTAITVRQHRYSPDAEFQYIRNSDTDPLIAGSAVQYDITATDENGVVNFLNGTTLPIAGVAVRTIAAGGFGWIQVKGKVPVPVTSSDTSFADVDQRGGVRVSDTNVATNSFLVGTATDGVMGTSAVSTTSIPQQFGARRVYTIQAPVNLGTDGATDIRAQAIIF